VADDTATAEDTAKSEETVTKPSKSKDSDAKSDLVSTFLKLSHYKKEDVIGHHDGRRTVVTSNGGKYEVSPKGKRIRVLSGPETPATLEEAAAEEEEE
jgi:hypothetical protein